MNNILKYSSILLIAVLINISAKAQKIDSYTYRLPGTYLNEPGKIYIEDFKNKGEIEADFGKNYASSLKSKLAYKNSGYVKGVKLYNPWLTTKLYEVVNSEDDANYIIKGDYLYTQGNTSKHEEQLIYETSGTNKLPIHYYKYTKSTYATIDFKMGLYSKGKDAPVRVYPYKDTKKKTKSANLKQPYLASSNTLIKDLSSAVTSKYIYQFTPTLVKKTYKFEKVKPENKALKKEFKKKRKALKTLAKTGNINEMGKIYINMLKEEPNNSDIHKNLGICYELIGNYTKAQEFYIKSADKKGIKRITNLVKVKELFLKLGLEVTEGEF